MLAALPSIGGPHQKWCPSAAVRGNEGNICCIWIYHGWKRWMNLPDVELNHVHCCRWPPKNYELWNAIISPLLPLSIYGVLWYQGKHWFKHTYMIKYNCTHMLIYLHYCQLILVVKVKMTLDPPVDTPAPFQLWLKTGDNTGIWGPWGKLIANFHLGLSR